MSEILNILIGADIVPTPSNINLFNSSDSEKLIGNELNSILTKSDCRIFNLETPLTDISKPINKSGPVLISPESTINGIKSLNPSLLVLANNHILDNDDIGVDNTVKVLSNNQIPFIGIGKTNLERNQFYIIEKNNIRVGIYNCCEHEFSIQKEGRWGANPYDPLVSFDSVNELKKQCDYVIVLYHGGKEFHRYPSPDLKRIFHKFADKGADCVIAQHTHCIGTYEKYNESLLVYGQGNFLFDDDDIEYQEYLKNGLLINLEIEKNHFNPSFIPVVKQDNHIKLADESERKDILSDFEDRSQNIKDDLFLQNEYSKKAEEAVRGYLLNLHCGNKLDTIFIRLFLKLNRKKANKFLKKTLQTFLNTRNYFTCESHRELLEKGLDNLLFQD